MNSTLSEFSRDIEANQNEFAHLIKRRNSLRARKDDMADQKKIIAVTGATGAQGGSVVRFLLKDGKYHVRGITRKADSPSAQGSPRLPDTITLSNSFRAQETRRRGGRGQS